MTKEKSVIRSHAIRRFWERFHIKLDYRVRGYIKYCIKNHKTLLDDYKAQYPNRTMHVVVINNKQVPLVYDHKLDEVVTCFPNMLSLDWTKIK